MNGTAITGERVVIVEVNSGRVSLSTGRVADADSSRVRVDNEGQHTRQRPAAENPDEFRERSFPVSDIHLLKEQEAKSLQDRTTAQSWFGEIYQDRVVDNIHRALKRLKTA